MCGGRGGGLQNKLPQKEREVKMCSPLLWLYFLIEVISPPSPPPHTYWPFSYQLWWSATLPTKGWAIYRRHLLIDLCCHAGSKRSLLTVYYHMVIYRANPYRINWIIAKDAEMTTECHFGSVMIPKWVKIVTLEVSWYQNEFRLSLWKCHDTKMSSNCHYGSLVSCQENFAVQFIQGMLVIRQVDSLACLQGQHSDSTGWTRYVWCAGLTDKWPVSSMVDECSLGRWV